MENNFKKILVQLLLITSIMLAVLSIFLRYVILNETTYLNILSENSVYGNIKDSIYEKMDSLLSAKNIKIDNDMKESIITEEDIEREANNAVHGILGYLKTGENNVSPLDTSVYKQRISDILDSVISSVIKPSGNELSFNDSFYAKNMAYTKNKLEFHEMNYVKKTLKDGQDKLKIEKLMSKEEAEARVREILKQKGLTEEQAIEKAQKKGITEEQALKILASYGITIDDYETGGSSPSGNSSDKTGNPTDNTGSKSKDNTGSSGSKDTGKKIEANSDNQTNVSTEQNDRNAKSKLDIIKNKLLDEASKGIDKEVEKMDFSKVLESSRVQKLAKITSIIYKLFWLFISIPIITMAVLIKMNIKDFKLSLRYIGTAFVISGLVLTVFAFSIYNWKIYENININPVYIKDVFSNIVRHTLMVLAKYGVITLVIGIFMFVPIIYTHSKNKIKNI